MQRIFLFQSNESACLKWIRQVGKTVSGVYKPQLPFDLSIFMTNVFISCHHSHLSNQRTLKICNSVSNNYGIFRSLKDKVFSLHHKHRRNHSALYRIPWKNYYLRFDCIWWCKAQFTLFRNGMDANFCFHRFAYRLRLVHPAFGTIKRIA